MDRWLAAEVRRLIRPGLLVVIALVAFLSLQTLQTIHTHAAKSIDQRAQREQFCANQTFRPVDCDAPAPSGPNPAVAAAQSYETPLGRLHLVILQLGSAAGVVGFGALAAAAAASDWSSAAIRLRRQLCPSGVRAGMLAACAATALAIPSALTAWAVLLASGGSWGGPPPDTLVVARDALAAAFIIFVVSAVGVCIGQLVGNPLAAAGTFVMTTIVLISVSSSPPVANPAHAVAALMRFTKDDPLVQDRMWGVVATANAWSGALVLAALAAIALSLHAILWRRRAVLV
jgi:hypothetical protein